MNRDEINEYCNSNTDRSEEQNVEDQYVSHPTMLENKLNFEEQKLLRLQSKLMIEEQKLMQLQQNRRAHHDAIHKDKS